MKNLNPKKRQKNLLPWIYQLPMELVPSAEKTASLLVAVSQRAEE
jgi:hypothetical protein